MGKKDKSTKKIEIKKEEVKEEIKEVEKEEIEEESKKLTRNIKCNGTLLKAGTAIKRDDNRYNLLKKYLK